MSGRPPPRGPRNFQQDRKTRSLKSPRSQDENESPRYKVGHGFVTPRTGHDHDTKQAVRKAPSVTDRNLRINHEPRDNKRAPSLLTSGGTRSNAAQYTPDRAHESYNDRARELYTRPPAHDNDSRPPLSNKRKRSFTLTISSSTYPASTGPRPTKPPRQGNPRPSNTHDFYDSGNRSHASGGYSERSRSPVRNDCRSWRVLETTGGPSPGFPLKSALDKERGGGSMQLLSAKKPELDSQRRRSNLPQLLAPVQSRDAQPTRDDANTLLESKDVQPTEAYSPADPKKIQDGVVVPEGTAAEASAPLPPFPGSRGRYMCLLPPGICREHTRRNYLFYYSKERDEHMDAAFKERFQCRVCTYKFHLDRDAMDHIASSPHCRRSGSKVVCLEVEEYWRKHPYVEKLRLPEDVEDPLYDMVKIATSGTSS